MLDAGSGNGYFSWLAYKSGARVVALNSDADQVRKAKGFLVDYQKANPSRLQFEQRNLYDLGSETRTFDEIICFEVLEHIRDDRAIVSHFYRILKPGGVLHICSPNRLHPRHQAEALDAQEKGGHVRAGYTEEDYQRVLEPIGFSVDNVVGIGPHSVYLADKALRFIRNKWGDIPALPLLPFGLLFVWLAKVNPPRPFSLYVRAVKPHNRGK